ncbi:galactose-3-O-sulfotransferase 2-like isoform X2 [Salarias fasciatus]|uniref:galactose-3-O-sulfotransferase 2-like isoform X2 n=1 Tax=Salarias fasciatus TaxID=181472 RepID=UPI001177039F|nr:galactose-3-O-sulfotransferase 2-like isoform X2 [Salarias fasciatus]
MAISATLRSLSLTLRRRFHVLGIVLLLFMAFYFLHDFRKHWDNSLSTMYSFYPRPIKHLVDSLKRAGGSDDEQDSSSTSSTSSMSSTSSAPVVSRDPFWDQLQDSSDSCSPKLHIVFLKSQRSDSGQIQNILFRYGEKRNLTFALPQNRALKFSYPELFQSTFVEGVQGDGVKRFHILCNEMRFRKSEVAKVMPADTFYFSMLRHPIATTQSMFLYFKYVSSSSDIHTLDEVLEDYFGRHTPAGAKTNHLLTTVAFDFGLNVSVAADPQDLELRAAKAIEHMEEDFDLLLIHEYFDESLVLLRHKLCWSLEDVATFRRSERKDQPGYPVLPDTAEHIQRWNALDWKIYQHFNATFWSQVEREVGAEQMKREVSELRQLQAELTKTCLRGRFKNIPKELSSIKLEWNGGDIKLGFNINQQLDNHTYGQCQKHLTPEMQYTSTLYDRHFPQQAGQK